MRIKLAYLSIILLWATTPLTIKWSAESASFIFGAGARMLIATGCMLLVLLMCRQKLASHRKAKITYFAVSTQIYGVMMSVYWGAQFVPSGWISVIFGLSPFLTALFAAIWLQERNLTLIKLCAYLLGLSGIAVLFSSALQINIQAVYGICAILLAVCLQTASAVWVKRINAKLPAFKQVTGGLLFALPAYFVTWVIVDDAQLPQHLSFKNMASIVYLGVIATCIGFVMYYYLLIHLSATSVGLIPMISPVIALYLGQVLNNEPMTLSIMTGTSLIIASLLIYQFLERILLSLSNKMSK